MRTFKKPNYDWLMNFTELRDICLEVYGVPYDLQMGERGQGEYDIVTTGQEADIQGYWIGLGQGYSYDAKYLEDSKWVPFVEGDTQDDYSRGELMAIVKWQASKAGQHDRAFDKVGDNGEYTFYQPDLQVVINDLCVRGEIPKGTYMITIDW